MRVVEFRLADAHGDIGKAALCGGAGKKAAVSAHEDDVVLIVDGVAEVVGMLFLFAKFGDRAGEFALHGFEDGIVQRRRDWSNGGLVAGGGSAGNKGQLDREQPGGDHS